MEQEGAVRDEIEYLNLLEPPDGRHFFFLKAGETKCPTGYARSRSKKRDAKFKDMCIWKVKGRRFSYKDGRVLSKCKPGYSRDAVTKLCRPKTGIPRSKKGRRPWQTHTSKKIENMYADMVNVDDLEAPQFNQYTEYLAHKVRLAHDEDHEYEYRKRKKEENRNLNMEREYERYYNERGEVPVDEAGNRRRGGAARPLAPQAQQDLWRNTQAYLMQERQKVQNKVYGDWNPQARPPPNNAAGGPANFNAGVPRQQIGVPNSAPEVGSKRKGENEQDPIDVDDEEEELDNGVVEEDGLNVESDRNPKPNLNRQRKPRRSADRDIANQKAMYGNRRSKRNRSKGK